MDSKKVQQLLERYREDRARYRILIQQRELLDQELEMLAQQDGQERIAGAALRARPSERVGGKGGTGQSVTESIAMQGDGEKDELLRELTGNRIQVMRMERRLQPVEIAMEGLYERERFVIKRYYVEDMSWNSVRVQYEKEYGISISDKQIRRIRGEAIVRMTRILGDDPQNNHE